MSLLCTPTGSEGVRNYRFKHAQLGQVLYDDGVDSKFVQWLQENGMDWDGWWTNGWSDESHAVAAIMREYDIPVIVTGKL